MRMALVYDWLVTMAGAESVVEQILALYPGIDVYTLVDFLPEKDRGFLKNSRVTTSFIQKLPFARTKYRNYLLLMPIAIEQFDLSEYDIIISVTHAVAKGVLTGPDQVHISYINTPIRYAWDFQHIYLKETRLDRGLRSFFVRILLHYIRLWDSRTSNGVDYMIANSKYISRRIKKVYGRESVVVYPPVNVEQFVPGVVKEEFYLAASRIVPYKKMSLIVEAFSDMSEKKLIVIGDGPELEAIKVRSGSNIEFLGYQSREVLIDYMQRAKAFVFAAEEDFGIIVVEAQACGTPVIAYCKGGASETVLDGVTGILFDKQTSESLKCGIERFERMSSLFDVEKIRQHAEKFSTSIFRKMFRELVESVVTQFKENDRAL